MPPAWRMDAITDYAATEARVANLPCSEASYEAVLKELARWNNPGEDLNKTVRRFQNNNLTFSRPQLHKHPTMVLFRSVKNMLSETDRSGLKKEHWNELDVPQRWHNPPEWRPLTQDDLQRKNRPLWHAIQRCSVGEDRVTVGIHNFQHEAVFEVANRLQTLTHGPVSTGQVELIIGKNAILRPLRQHAIAWRTFSTTAETRLATLWTLAAAASFWGLEFVESFLEFCISLFVGPICGVSHENCKEAFAACVAVATIARARPISMDELRGCTKVWWMHDVLERAGSAAQNTLLCSRYITKVAGKRVAATACNRWESPINPNISPVYSFYVVGKECGHPQNANEDGTFGVRCDGRFVLATRMEDFGEEKMRDGALRVSLTHNNPQAANNILAWLERRGIWAYIQGPKECLNCAYKRALRHGFPVIIDGPQAQNVTTQLLVTNNSALRRIVLPVWTFALLLTLLGLNQVTAIDLPLSGHQAPYLEPNATCGYSTPPTRSATSWSRLFGIIRALQSVILTVVAIRSGKRFVARSVLGMIAAVLSTFMTGFTGWILTDACAQYKSMAILKGFVTAAVNRVAFEMIDIVCMIVSLFSFFFAIIFPLTRMPIDVWALVQNVPLTLICMSAMYIWRWYDTGSRMATSRGVVGEPIPLLASHIVALILAVVVFVFTTEADNKAGAASYVSDGLMMGEVFLQYLFLK